MKLKYQRMTTWLTPVQLREMRRESNKKGVSKSELARRAWDFFANNGYPETLANKLK